ncbi:MAG: hypothetical protein PHC99_03185, partial [Methylococcales bacterium]|nr:hypothetical protein [Methylococcales bacterium]
MSFKKLKHYRIARYIGLGLLCFSPALLADKDSWSDSINVSGYAKFAASAPNREPTSVSIEDVSLFVSG